MAKERASDRLVEKGEPTFSILAQLDKIEIILALNWYAQNREKDHSHKYLKQYCVEHDIEVRDDQIKPQVATFGFVARLLSRGAILDDRSIAWFNDKISTMTSLEPPVDKPKREPIAKKSEEDKAQLSKIAVERCIGDIEQSVDSFIENGFKSDQSIQQILVAHSIVPSQQLEITQFFQKWRNELHLVINAMMKKEDIPEAEAYQNFSIVQLNKLLDYYDSILLTTVNDEVEKPTKKKKIRSPEAQVKHMKYLDSDGDLGLKSINPEKVVGASSIWVYHVPSRMLTNYISNSDSGFEVDRCSILNYSEEKSRSRKLRKPEQVLPKIMSLGKVALRTVLDELTTKDAPVSGRVNSQTILLRALI